MSSLDNVLNYASGIDKLHYGGLLESARTELAALRDAATFCDKHQPNGGKRAVCLVCAVQSLSAALSRISYLCGEPNEMECGPYDLDCDASAVVEQVAVLRKKAASLDAVIEYLREVEGNSQPLGQYSDPAVNMFCRNALLKMGIQSTPYISRPAPQVRHEKVPVIGRMSCSEPNVTQIPKSNQISAVQLPESPLTDVP